MVAASLANEELELLLYGVRIERSCSPLELPSCLLRISLQVEDLSNLLFDLIKEVGIRASHQSQTLLQSSCKLRRALGPVDGDTHRAWKLLKEKPPRIACPKQEITYGHRLRRTEFGCELGERRGRLSEQQTERFLRELAHCAVTLDHSPDEMTILALARHHRLTIYDAAYLELALREGVPLATLDGPLRTAARAAGVPLYKP